MSDVSIPSTPLPAPAPETGVILNLIVAQVGDTPAGLLRANVTLCWDRYAEKALIHPRLQELYCKRDLIDLAIGYYRAQVDTITGARSIKRSQIAGQLNTMRTQTQSEIEKVEKVARARRGMVSAPIAATAPVTPPVPCPTNPYIDGNDPRYQGDLYTSTGRRPQ